MVSYELMLVLKPDSQEKETEAEIKKLIEGIGGKPGSSQVIGRKPLSYAIQKFSEGIYILLNFSGGKIKDLEKKLKTQETVLRYLIMRQITQVMIS